MEYISSYRCIEIHKKMVFYSSGSGRIHFYMIHLKNFTHSPVYFIFLRYHCGKEENEDNSVSFTTQFEQWRSQTNSGLVEVRIRSSFLEQQDEYQTISPCINRLDLVKNTKGWRLFREVHICRSFNTCFSFYHLSVI